MCSIAWHVSAVANNVSRLSELSITLINYQIMPITAIAVILACCDLGTGAHILLAISFFTRFMFTGTQRVMFYSSLRRGMMQTLFACLVCI
jgi:hypothetical protein